MTMVGTLQVVAKKTSPDKIAKNIQVFLRKFVVQFFTDPSKPSGLNFDGARKALDLSQGYLSDLLNGKKSASLSVVLALRDATGASFEEITGHKPPLVPRFPMSLLPSATRTNEIVNAVEEGKQNERPSGHLRTSAPSVRPPRR